MKPYLIQTLRLTPKQVMHILKCKFVLLSNYLINVLLCGFFANLSAFNFWDVLINDCVKVWSIVKYSCSIMIVRRNINH